MTLAFRVPGERGCAPVDFDALVTPAEILSRVPDLTRHTIVMWAQRGKLTAKGRRGRAPLYRWGDVVTVERLTRQNPRSSRYRDPNAYAEGWVGTVRRECLDRVLIYDIRHLLAVLGGYLAHYNGCRPASGPRATPT